jgi:hypothetical protein
VNRPEDRPTPGRNVKIINDIKMNKKGKKALLAEPDFAIIKTWKNPVGVLKLPSPNTVTFWRTD